MSQFFDEAEYRKQIKVYNYLNILEIMGKTIKKEIKYEQKQIMNFVYMLVFLMSLMPTLFILLTFMNHWMFAVDLAGISYPMLIVSVTISAVLFVLYQKGRKEYLEAHECWKNQFLTVAEDWIKDFLSFDFKNNQELYDFLTYFNKNSVAGLKCPLIQDIDGVEEFEKDPERFTFFGVQMILANAMYQVLNGKKIEEKWKIQEEKAGQVMA